MIGRIISDRYVIKQVVGTGGMAVVYRAWDLQNRTTVAIKILRPEYESDRDFVRRFSREAEAAAKVSHENIVNMLDVGAEGDMRYIVMEYVDGQTLKELIRQNGALNQDMAVNIALSILAAVEHAHKNGIVHRDIKPQNILVDAQGHVKVADFGIARLKNAAQTTRVDEGTAAMGSVHYFSPEQARGEVADEKSDLYSVGVVLYEMLTGSVPFDGETSVSVALKHVNEAPQSMREIEPRISQALDEVVQRALAKDSAKRYQSAEEMAADLRRAVAHPKGGFVKYPLSREEQEALREKRRREKEKRHRHLMQLGAVATVAGVIIIIYLISWYFRTMYRTVKVPSLENMTYAEMQEALKQQDLTLSAQGTYSEEAEEGRLISQNPTAGTRLKRGKEVEVVISLGSEWFYLENMSGEDLDDVLTELSDLGAKDVTVERVLSEKTVNTVIAQSPQAGWHSRRESIVLQISGERTGMPYLSGLQLDGAKALIESAGLELGTVVSGYSADAPAGTVIAQSIEPNSQVLLGTTVDLTISQSQNPMYYPESDFFVVVPLDNVAVSILLTTPSGTTTEAYSQTLSAGTHAIPLTSSESGLHALRVVVDGVQLESTVIQFE